MALFRHTRQRSDLLGDISKFKEEYLKRGKLIELGWKEVPWVDGSGLKSWHQLRAKLVEEGRGSIVGENGWPKLPLEIRNEEIVGIKEDFCREVEALADINQVENFIDNMPAYHDESRIYAKVSAYDGLYGSVGWTFNVEGILNGEVPSDLDCNRRDAMIQFGPWWTRSHIEIGGSDSISKTIVGEKLFLICGSYTTSIAFDNVVGTPQYFMELIRRGPKASELPSDIWFYLSNKSSVLCQPSLCAHAVLTMSLGVSLVTGWEAHDLRNSRVAQRTFTSFGLGARKGVVEKLLKDKGKEAALEWALKRDKDVGGSSDVTEHIQSLVKNEFTMTKRPYKKRIKWGGVRKSNKLSKTGDVGELEEQPIVYTFLPPKDPSKL